jgi:hypothetical protein
MKARSQDRIPGRRLVGGRKETKILHSSAKNALLTYKKELPPGEKQENMRGDIVYEKPSVSPWMTKNLINVRARH